MGGAPDVVWKALNPADILLRGTAAVSPGC